MNIFKAFAEALRNKKGPLAPWGAAGTRAGDYIKLLSGAKLDYNRLAGRVYDNSAVAAGISFAWRSLQFPRMIVQDRFVDANSRVRWREDVEHPFPDAWDSGSHPYDLPTTYHGMMNNLFAKGNCYFWTLRNVYGEVIGYQYIPVQLMTPRNDKYNPKGHKLISYYEYKPVSGVIEDLDPDWVIHLRMGVNPANPMLGLSPLEASLREIVGDNEASSIGTALLMNQGVPGVVLSPKQGTTRTLTDDQRRSFVDRWKDKTTGDRAGEPNLLPFPVDVTQLGIDPKKMLLDKQRSIAVGRICADMGFDPMVLGLPSEYKTYSNFKEANEAAMTNTLMPLLRIITGQLTAQALPKFMLPSEQRGRKRIWMDLREVPALQETMNDAAERSALLYEKGVIKRSEAKQDLEYDFDASDEVYITDVQKEIAEASKPPPGEKEKETPKDDA